MKMLAWHATGEMVHHTHPQCTAGQSALTVGASSGDGGKPHCGECAVLVADEVDQATDPSQQVPDKVE